MSYQDMSVQSANHTVTVGHQTCLQIMTSHGIKLVQVTQEQLLVSGTTTTKPDRCTEPIGILNSESPKGLSMPQTKLLFDRLAASETLLLTVGCVHQATRGGNKVGRVWTSTFFLSSHLLLPLFTCTTERNTMSAFEERRFENVPCYAPLNIFLIFCLTDVHPAHINI